MQLRMILYGQADILNPE